MTNGNEPAFARAAFYHPDGAFIHDQEGLTKREYFAAMRKEPMFGEDTLSLLWAIAIMGSNPPSDDSAANIQWWIEAHEKFAVMRADALIKALNSIPCSEQ